MKKMFPSCCICAAEADWVRTRMPNEQQMDTLCHRHFKALKERNHVLASYYDVIGSLPVRRSEQSPQISSGRASCNE